MREKNYEGHYMPQSLDGFNGEYHADEFADDFGTIFEDAGNFASSVASTLGDAVPDFIKDGVSKFANSAIGQVVLVAISGSAYYALAPSLGPQVAAITFAMPGMARGDNFVKAWTDGFSQRLADLIKYFVSTGVPNDIAAQRVTDGAQSDMQKAQQYVDQIGGVANLGGIDFQTLAAKAGIREDMAAQYLANAVGNLNLPNEYNWDPKTGKAIGPQIQDYHEKIRRIQASIDPTKAKTAKEKAMAVANIAHALGVKQQATTQKKVVHAGVGAGIGLLGAIALGASLPWTLGAAAGLGLVGLLTTKGD